MTNLLGCIDGLFFLEREINNDVLCALWNPATREVRDLLSADGIKFESFFNSNRVFGFGLDVLTNDYKVNENAAVTTYLNGSYYWMFKEKISISTLLSFNFGNEVFEGPPHDYAIRSWTPDLDDSIAILNEVDMFVYDVWSCSLIWASGCFGLISYNVKTKKMRNLEFHHPRLGTRSPTWSGFGLYYIL
ncbi:hypothetical protein R3W88_032005 [Solanum pinnatisectum]|uniref:Uncharacterized protein n=1 Tax=Solanum pinnatisectum TaxID=50273 RepID=A0AAV9LN88_9SOLN|nr:hypothetical protein R3W88_032005 [Solanum pinnatisectum]